MNQPKAPNNTNKPKLAPEWSDLPGAITLRYSEHERLLMLGVASEWLRTFDRIHENQWTTDTASIVMHLGPRPRGVWHYPIMRTDTDGHEETISHPLADTLTHELEPWSKQACGGNWPRGLSLVSPLRGGGRIVIRET